MDKKSLIQLTDNLYRLTLLFPKKEPLRYKIRELADDILADLISTGSTRVNLTESGPLSNPKKEFAEVKESSEIRSPQTLERLEVLDSFFEVAKAQNWTPLVDVLRIQEEYSKIKAEMKAIAKRPAEMTRVQPVQIEAVKIELQQEQEQSSPEHGLSERKERILAFLRENGRAQVWQIKQILPEVTKRTLRRDFENLLKQGLIERIGERNDTFYQLKR